MTVVCALDCRGTMSGLGHSRPMYSAPVLANVRYAHDSDQILRSSELTLCANSGLMHRSKLYLNLLTKMCVLQQPCGGSGDQFSARPPLRNASTIRSYSTAYAGTSEIVGPRLAQSWTV